MNWSRTEITEPELHNAASTMGKSFLKVFWLVTYYNFSLSTWNYITAFWNKKQGHGNHVLFLVTATEQVRLAERQSVKELPKYPRYTSSAEIGLWWSLTATM